MQEYALRRVLSDELHARAFHDFDGAGRFIRFVFLVGGDDSKILAYINKFLSTEGLAPIDTGEKFPCSCWGKVEISCSLVTPTPFT
jgi:CRISPR/Cas system-associated protein Cas10 (large subunit of type III CRISPR-Cas system)